MSSGKGVIAKVVFVIIKSFTLRLSLIERVLVGFFDHKKGLVEINLPALGY
jgi:hypothetical protein